METHKKIKLKLREGINPKDYPELFERRENTVMVKIGPSFTKIMDIDMRIQQILYSKLGISLMGYIHFLLLNIDYENKIHFDKVINIGINNKTLKIKIRPKLVKMGVIKKYNGFYYINPLFGHKGKAINPDLIHLFKEDNNNIYNIKL